MTFAIWVTGLPGSGKSTIAQEFVKLYKGAGKVQVLNMDDVRKTLTPRPSYSREERDFAYRTLVLIWKNLYDNGINVVFDATANRQEYRDLARHLIQNFKEIYVRCPMDIVKEREAKRKAHAAGDKLYEKAQAAPQNTMPGVGVPYEEPKAPELVIESDKEMPQDAAKRILELVI